jgi:hypothetical protein
MEFLIKYWSQVVVVLTAVLSLPFYFLKRSFDLKSKKIEIKTTAFLNQKTAAISAFLSSYVECNQFYWQVNQDDLISKKITITDCNKIRLPIENKIHSSLYTLNLLLSNHELIEFNKIYATIAPLHQCLIELSNSGANSKQVQEKYNRLIDNTSNETFETIKKISDDFKKYYGQ